MTIDLEVLEGELASLTPEERLQLARWLVDSVLREPKAPPADPARAVDLGRTVQWWAGGYGRKGRRNPGSGDRPQRLWRPSVSYLLDTGFLYALLNRGDRSHEAARQATGHIDARVYLPTPVTIEVAYLIRRDLGADALAEPAYTLVEPVAADYRRAADVVRQYHDAQIDFVDAILVAVAERLDVTRILTLDQRHFRLFRPRHCDAFELIP